MRKWLKTALGLVIIAFLLWYLAEHWKHLKSLLKLNPKQLTLMYFLCFLSHLAAARIVQQLTSALKIKTGFWDMMRLHNAALLLNYAPMKFGTIFRANYLKRRYGLAYAHFATFFLFITFLMTTMAAIIGLIALLAVFGIEGYENKILAAIFLATIVISLLFLFFPLPAPAGQGRLSTILRNFLSSRSQVSKEVKTIFTALILLSVNFLLTAARIGIIYHSMGKDIHIGGYLILGTLGFVVLFISLTPGSLGIRELILGFGAIVVGIQWEVGLFAAIIDRAVVMSYIFVVGGGCAAWLWHKSPADFKKQQDNSLQ